MELGPNQTCCTELHCGSAFVCKVYKSEQSQVECSQNMWLWLVAELLNSRHYRYIGYPFALLKGHQCSGTGKKSTKGRPPAQLCESGSCNFC